MHQPVQLRLPCRVMIPQPSGFCLAWLSAFTRFVYAPWETSAASNLVPRASVTFVQRMGQRTISVAVQKDHGNEIVQQAACDFRWACSLDTSKLLGVDTWLTGFKTSFNQSNNSRALIFDRFAVLCLVSTKRIEDNCSKIKSLTSYQSVALF